MTFRKNLFVSGCALVLATVAFAPREVEAQPTSCGGPDTREGQIKRGICVAQKMKSVVTNRESATRMCDLEIPCVIGMCHVARNVCKGILDKDCNHGGIELPADGPAFRNAACRAARAGCSAGTAEEQRICGEIKPHVPANIVPEQPERREMQWVNPKFEVVSVLYSPPGAGSEVNYAEGSAFGAKTQLQTTVSNSVIVEGSTTAVDIEAGYTYAQTSSFAYELRKSKTSTLGLVSQTDGVDHDKDVFVVWVNPQLVVEKRWYPGGWTRFSAGMKNRDGSKVRVVRVTGAMLKNPALMPADLRRDFAGFGPEDFATILKASPFSGGTWNADRFSKVETIDVIGPAVQGDSIVKTGIELAEDATTTRGRAVSNALDITVMTGGGVSFFVEIGVKVGGKLSFEGVSAEEGTTTASQRANLDLSSSTVGYREVVDVYFDRVYRTFAFKGRGRPIENLPNVTGIVRDAAGRAMGGQVVTLKMPDGSFRRTGTDAKGQYRLYDVPTGGSATVMTGGDAKTITLQKGAVVDLRAGNGPKFAPIPKGATPSPAAPVPMAPVPMRPIPRLGK